MIDKLIIFMYTGQKVNSSTQINESDLDNKVTVIRNTPPNHYFTILCV